MKQGEAAAETHRKKTTPGADLRWVQVRSGEQVQVRRQSSCGVLFNLGRTDTPTLDHQLAGSHSHKVCSEREGPAGTETTAATSTCRLALASGTGKNRRNHSRSGAPALSVNSQLFPLVFWPSVSIPEPCLLLLPLTHLYSSSLIFLVSVSDLITPACPPSI